jgi:hypothetical protein
LGESKLHHRVEVVQVDGDAASQLGNAPVAGSADNLSGLAGTLNSPGERVLAAAGTED